MSVNVLIWSDIHEEFEELALPDEAPAVDAVLIAGDIWTGGRCVSKLERIAQWANAPIVAVPGNHDYYGDNIRHSDQRMRDEARVSTFDIRILNRGVTMIGDLRVIGATLWTDYRLRLPAGASNWVEKYACEQDVEDHKNVRWGFNSQFRHVSANDLASLHYKHKDFIQKQLSLPHEGPTLVLTHHAPCELSVKDYDRSEKKLDCAYASDLTELMLDFGPDYWVHGHTHRRVAYEIGNTQVLSNPKGYPGQNPNFDVLEVFSLPSRKREASLALS